MTSYPGLNRLLPFHLRLDAMAAWWPWDDDGGNPLRGVGQRAVRHPRC